MLTGDFKIASSARGIHQGPDHMVPLRGGPPVRSPTSGSIHSICPTQLISSGHGDGAVGCAWTLDGRGNG